MAKTMKPGDKVTLHAWLNEYGFYAWLLPNRKPTGEFRWKRVPTRDKEVILREYTPRKHDLEYSYSTLDSSYHEFVEGRVKKGRPRRIESIVEDEFD